MSDVRAEFYEHNDQNWVRISIVGDPNVVERKARGEDAERFQLEWDAFQSGQEAVPKGTDLMELPQMNEARARDLKVKGIRTVEELAGASDMAVSRIGVGGVDLRKAAIFMVQARERQAVKAIADAQPVADKPRRGRPPKEKDEAA